MDCSGLRSARTRRVLPLALLPLALCAAHAARADSVADEADYRFYKATALYRQGKVDEALGEFLFSNRLVHNKNVLFDIARCYEQLKRFNEAYRWYGAILAEKELPQQERDGVLAALQRLAPSLALARIDSDPPGAQVYVGRKDLGARGVTPVTLALPPGETKLILEKEGYKPALIELPLAVGKTLHAEEELQPIVGRLLISGEPSSFDLRLSGEGAESGEVLLRSAGVLKLPPGPHTLVVEAKGFAPQQLEAQVVAEEETRLEFKLVPLPPPSGTIVFRANVDGALLEVDGKAAGFSPTVVYGVEAGPHAVRVEAEGREPLTQNVEVRTGQPTVFEPRLAYALPRVQAAERQLTLAADAPSSITILTAAEIRGAGWLTLAEALRGVRGFFTTDDRTYTSLGVRGYSAAGTYNNRVLVLSDGHITNDLSLGQGFIGEDFDTDLSDVERIEVVRGAGSVIYGSAAFLAVVNVVHKTPQPGLHGAVAGTALDQSLLGARVTAGDGNKWLALHAGAYRSDGEKTFFSPMASGTPGAPTGVAQNVDGERAAHADLRARYGDFSFVASFNQRAKDVPTAPGDTVFGVPGTDRRDQRWFAELGWARAFANGIAADARLSYDGRRNDASLQLAPASATSTANAPASYAGSSGRLADWLDAEARIRLPELLHNRLFLGAELQDVLRVRLSAFSPAGSISGATQAPATDYSQLVFSAYAGDDIRLASFARLNAAVRIDSYPDASSSNPADAGVVQGFATAVDPRIALIAQPYAKGNLKVIYGKAFRAPSFYERFFTNGASQVPGKTCYPDASGTIRCAPLVPETIDTLEFEHVHAFDDAFSLLAAGSWSAFTNILRLTTLPGTSGKQFAFGNRNTQTHSLTGELEARYQPRPGLLVAAWYAYARVQNDSGTLVPNVPKHTASLRVLWPLFGEALSVSSEALWSSRRYTAYVNQANQETLVGEELLWNLGLSGQTPGGLRYSAFVQDLLDQRPLEPAGLEVPFLPKAVPQPGRTLRASVEASF
jgi:outer membrane receptor for ferrienterochelin and colicins